MSDEKADVTRELRTLARLRKHAEKRRAEVMDRAEPLIRKGTALGLTPTDLAAIFSVQRRTIYRILNGKE